MRRPLLFGSALIVILALVVPAVRAAEFLAPPGDGENLTVGAEETHRNLYAAAGNLTLSGMTEGDLWAAGGTVTVGGAVAEDLVVAGGTVIVSAPVGGDARLGGGTVAISAPVGGDLLVAGGTVTLAEQSSVGGDLLAAGGSVVIDALVTGSVRIAGGTVTINGRVAGDIFVVADERLTFGPRSDVSGKVTYRGPSEAVIAPGAKVGAVEFTKVEGRRPWDLRALLTVAFLTKILAGLIAGLLLLRFMGRRAQRIVEGAYREPWGNLGVGFLAAVAVPAAAIGLLVTVVGYYVALVLVAWYVLALLLASVFSALLLGAAVRKLIMKTPEVIVNWEVVVIGVVLGRLLIWLPVVGWAAAAGLFLIAFGSMLRTLYAEVLVER